MQHSTCDRPSVIFLDAAGTLFGVQGSVGYQYAKIAQEFGVDLPADDLNHAFFKTFKATTPPAFSAINPEELRYFEYHWWMDIAIQTFQQVDAFDLFPDFNKFFAVLYDYFATAEPWFVYPDVLDSLKRWQQLGIPLGILSNFDSRIFPVVRSLGLEPYFSSVTISSEAGVAKPDPHIFHIALEKHQATADSAWHIGDSFEEDYQAACAAGLRGIWLRRK